VGEPWTKDIFKNIEVNLMNINRVIKNSLSGALLLIFVLLSSITVSASTQAPNKVKVLIAFTRHPGPAEQALVHSFGGDIKYTYDLVPAIAASVPEVALDGLRRNPLVISIEPDIEAHVVDAELDNTWGVERIGAGVVHAQGNRGVGVKVGILDTGIDLDHPDLAYDPSCSASFVEGETLDDGHSHGTHTAGTVAALDNDKGVVGVAPELTLCIYKVFSNSGSGDYSDIIAALERAVADGVQVTNNSYGSSADPGDTVNVAFDNAYAAGVIHVGAAGNYGNFFGTGENCIYPARWDTVIATASTTQSDTRAFNSSTCPEVELAAPGDQIYSTMPGGGYGYKSGTSMASPHVAGTAALVLASFPDWSNDQVRTQLQTTADELGDLGRDSWYGYGLVDADEAAASTNNPPVAYGQAVVTDEDTPVAITLMGSDPDGDPLTFSVVTGPFDGTLSGTAPNLTYLRSMTGRLIAISLPCPSL
jgi:subtilisin